MLANGLRETAGGVSSAHPWMFQTMMARKHRARSASLRGAQNRAARSSAVVCDANHFQSGLLPLKL